MAFSIRLDPEIEARLQVLAERTGRTKAYYVREAIEAHLDELEQLYWADGVIKAWEAQGRPRRPAEEFWAEVGE